MRQVARPAALVAIVAVAVGLYDCALAQEMEAADVDIEYGFRQDPMEWLRSEDSVEGAFIRARILGRPRDGDASVLREAIETVLTQHEGSALDAGTLIRLAELGSTADRPEIESAVLRLALEAEEDGGRLGAYGLQALCSLGGDDPVVSRVRDASLVHEAAQSKRGFRRMCPWTPVVQLRALWSAREFGDVEEAMLTDLAWIAESMNAVGAVSYKDPWGFLELAGAIDHPLGRRIVEKMIPFILRAQKPDGSWGSFTPVPAAFSRSAIVFRALTRYGLLDALRELPPLPPDWRVVRSIPLPPVQQVRDPEQEEYRTMAWGEGALWVYSPQDHAATAISPEDGAVVKRISLPGEKSYGIGWWDGGLALVTDRLLVVDPTSGQIIREIPWRIGEFNEPRGIAQVDGKVWVADSGQWVVVAHDGSVVDPEVEIVLLSSPTGGRGTALAAAGDGVWHFDRSLPFLMKTDAGVGPIPWGMPEAEAGFVSPQPVEWAEKPFGAATDGIAWDGEGLWALDGESKRVCLIERVAR